MNASHLDLSPCSGDAAKKLMTSAFAEVISLQQRFRLCRGRTSFPFFFQHTTDSPFFQLEKIIASERDANGAKCLRRVCMQ